MDWLIDICLWFLYYFGITLGTIIVALMWIGILAIIWNETREVIYELRNPKDDQRDPTEYFEEYR